MPVNINYIKLLVYDLAAKQSTAFPSPDDFNNYSELASLDLFNYYNDERDKMLLRVRTGDTVLMPSTLTQFVSAATGIYSASLGGILKPDNFVYNLSTTTLNNILIKETDTERLPSYLNSTIDLPTETNPIFIEGKNIFNVYPITVTPIRLNYIRKPIAPYWSYTMVDGRPSYRQIGSIDFDFPETETLRLAARVLAYMGISIANDDLARQAQQMVISAS